MLTMSADLRDYKMNNAYKIKPISHLDFQNIIKRVAVTSSVENQSITIHCKSVDWFLHFWENKVNFSKHLHTCVLAFPYFASKSLKNYCEGVYFQ